MRKKCSDKLCIPRGRDRVMATPTAKFQKSESYEKLQTLTNIFQRAELQNRVLILSPENPVEFRRF